MSYGGAASACMVLWRGVGGVDAGALPATSLPAPRFSEHLIPIFPQYVTADVAVRVAGAQVHHCLLWDLRPGPSSLC